VIFAMESLERMDDRQLSAEIPFLIEPHAKDWKDEKV